MINKYTIIATLAPILGKAAYDDYKNLVLRKKDMEKAGLIGGDNYYHRLAMCENAQKGLPHVITSFSGGIAKELKDIFCKSTGFCDKKDTLINAIKDSWKDMENNVEGLYHGLTDPNTDCKIWLNDLDYRTNTWKTIK
ncbi:MAG: hypothetical protein J6Y53_04840 [Alphaproteobacteria bacterium]|nr:hypothetical protein [Alphaproteobacteria bacterium]